MPDRESKSIVVFCDGTGNQLKAKGNTNVLRLHRMTLETPTQLRFYGPGVGTEGSPRASTAVGRTVTKVLGLAFGYGIKRNTVDAYTFIMNNWEPGDRIYLFGFSRGAYTARALAGMLRVIGLLRPGQENLIPYGLKLFWKQGDNKIDWELVEDYSEQFGRADFNRYRRNIEYLGVWDTVKAFGWFTRRMRLPFTRKLDNVKHIRHACSLDEWRAQYKAYGIDWGEQIKYDEAKADKRTLNEVWFAGVHSDVGGTFFPHHDLADISLQWITRGAIDAGLHVDPEKMFVERIVAGTESDQSPETYQLALEALPTNSACEPAHKMGKVWAVTGISGRRLLPTEKDRMKYYPGSTKLPRIHESVAIRMASDAKLRRRYEKKGVVAATPQEPWPRAADAAESC